MNMSDVKSNWTCGKKQAEIWVIAIGTGIKTSRAKPNARHSFFLHLQKIPYIIQIAAIAISVAQIPNVNITDLFNRDQHIGVMDNLIQIKVILVIVMGGFIASSFILYALALSLGRMFSR